MSDRRDAYGDRWLNRQMARWLSTLLLGNRWLLRRVQINLKDRVKVRPRRKMERYWDK